MKRVLLTAVCVMSCGPTGPAPLFKRLGSQRTGITFANTITVTDSVNVLTNPYVYNGGGVAVGDIDNDGLPDIFFAGNMVSSRLYLNKGDMRFADITQSAGVTTHGWVSGVTMVDINNDGYLDIYVSMSGPPWSTPEQRKNLLFINNGNRTFTESAAQYHLDDSGFTAQAVFFDYDGDGYLDVFLLGNSPQNFERSQVEIHPAGIRQYDPSGADKLYRNNGDGTFTDVSQQAGISAEAQFGLGVVVSDFNRDGWPDLYVSDDVVAEDVLYINNRNGTFTNKAGEWLKHTSFAGMGVDAADFNNDGSPDILQTDMMPEDLAARKRTSGVATDVADEDRRRHRFQGGYTQNTLQLNSGADAAGNITFSEIARLSGVAYTDWSWSALFGDVDNDGNKDLFISNGYPKAVTDYDYQTAMFRLRRVEGSKTSPRQLHTIDSLPGIRVPNYLFRNNGDLTFSDRAREWGIADPGFSYGAVLADLNNDGRMDLVVNNIDAPASVYENLRPANDSTHYLDILLRGRAPNRGAFGTALTLVAGGQHQYLYHTPDHGYLSAVADREHFGLGRTGAVDTLTVTWPDGKRQVLTHLGVDRVLTLTQDDAEPPALRAAGSVATTHHRFFQSLDSRHTPPYKHDESGLDDFTLQPLLPYQLSQHGPVLAVSDVNGDGRQDLFIGGSASVAGTLFLQQPDGRFIAAPAQPWATEQGYDVTGALFFDANGDGRPDLYLASGGYRRAPVAALLQDRLYINHGGGRFVRDTSALPAMITATAAVAAGDFTGDGKLDLFVGGRVLPRNYPAPTRSYLLRNDGDHFTDVTEQWAPELVHPGGMITAAVWIDFDGDGRLDLVTAGEWLPLQFFRNEGSHFRNVTGSMGLGNTRGWWWSLVSADINHDGHPDLIAGNFGLNHTFTTSMQSRLGVYAGDFTGNGRTGVLLTQDSGGRAVPLFGLATIGPSMYTIPLRFSTFAAFSQADIDAVLGRSLTARALHYEVDTFASLYLQNNGNGTFTATELPTMAQLAPLRGIVVTDVDGDGNLDLVVAGNLYDTAPNTAPADAGNGLWLKGDGRGHFAAVPPGESGFLAPYDVTGLAAIKTPAGLAVLVANSGDSLRAFLIRQPRP